MDSGRLIFDPAGGGGRQMLLFGGGGFFRGVPMSGAEDARRKRPFFTTHEELLLEEEYYDEQPPEKKRRLTPEQVQMLERSFEEDNKLEPERKSELARRLGVAPRQVAVWFQNRRARWKTKQLERDYGRLRAAYDALLADHRALLADSDRLRSQVSSLTDKLQAKELSASAAAGLEVESEVQTTVSATETAATAKPAGAVLPLKGQQDGLSTGTNGSAVVDVVEGTNHSDASYYTGEGYNCAEEEEAGVVSDEGCSFFPDAMLAAAVAHHEHAEDQEVAQIGNWSNWFWN